jgi:hypothetical protein
VRIRDYPDVWAELTSQVDFWRHRMDRELGDVDEDLVAARLAVLRRSSADLLADTLTSVRLDLAEQRFFPGVGRPWPPDETPPLGPGSSLASAAELVHRLWSELFRHAGARGLDQFHLAAARAHAAASQPPGQQGEPLRVAVRVLPGDRFEHGRRQARKLGGVYDPARQVWLVAANRPELHLPHAFALVLDHDVAQATDR